MMKYIRHETEGFVLFTTSDRVIFHATAARRLFGSERGLMSAGFVSVYNGIPTCHGGSESLRISSREDDTKSLCDQLGIQYPPPVQSVQSPDAPQPCENCNGFGVISFDPNLNPNKFPGEELRGCPRCHGTGESPDTDPHEKDESRAGIPPFQVNAGR
jgi:hypothetical protein